MKKLTDDFLLFSRRVFILAIVKLGLISALIGRMFYLQVFNHDRYKNLANNNRIRLQIIPPQRGKILDVRGRSLAYNQSYYRVLFYKGSNKDYMPTLHNLGKLLSLNNRDIESMVSKVKKSKVGTNVVLQEYLSWELISNTELHIPDLPGISVDVAQTRFYPYGSICAHITGYISYIQKDQKLPFHHPEFKVGMQGVEKTRESLLQGHAGIRRLEVNAKGVVLRELARQNSQVGCDQRLTIDAELQKKLHEEIPDTHNISAVLLDIHNGNILSSISTPMYDPNQFAQNLSVDYWKSLRDNENLPLVNKAVSRQYPPGSIFKIVVFIAALEEGISPDTVFNCSGSMAIGNLNFRCARRYGHQNINMYQAINTSCNVYIYNLAKKIGYEKIVRTAHMLGLGAQYNIGMTGELSGLVPTKEWKKKHYKQDWLVGDTINLSIGQGYLLTTPLQMVTMMARVASGKLVVPRLMLDNKDDGGNNFASLPVKSSHISFMRKALSSVVNQPTGTAYRHRITDANMAMAGKTGTAQIISIRNRSKIDNKKLDHHGIFVGYAPAHKPRFACAVAVENGGGGSKSAAPVAHKILLRAQTELKS